MFKNKILKLGFPLLIALFIPSCSENDEQTSYLEWTKTGSGLTASTTKNVLTEFVGSTNCPFAQRQMQNY